jgi:uncharacterized membrane protein
MNIYQAEAFHFVGRRFTRLLIWIAELAFSEIYISEVKLGISFDLKPKQLETFLIVLP